MFEDNIVFYVDLLGFATEFESSYESRWSSLRDLLHDIATARGQYESAVTEESLTFRPEVSTFSDHIVFSYKLEGSALDKNDLVKLALKSAERLIAGLAAKSLELGLLVRGGATLGSLYHRDGVVLGPAMVEAYRLESRVAIYPRVVISSSLHSAASAASSYINYFLEDTDGVTHFDYFRLMFASNLGPIPSTTWVEKIRNRINETIDKLESEQKGNQLSKWLWFRTTFNQRFAVFEESYDSRDELFLEGLL